MKKRRTARPRPRLQFKFWLYQDVEAESKLAEFIQYCKSKRQFATMLKNGLRLMWSLGERDTTVLFELFPWLVDSLKPAPPSDSGGLEDRLAARIEASVTAAIMNAPGLPATALVAAPMPKASAAIKQPAAPVAAIKAAPVADAGAIADNFLMSLGF